MLNNFRTQHIKGNVLIVSPGDQNDLLCKGAEAGDGPGGTGGDGVVVVPDAIYRAYQLNAVLHAAEAAGKEPDGLVRHQAVDRSDSRHIVLHVVAAGQKDVGQGQYLPVSVPIGTPDSLILYIDTPLQHLAAAEAHHITGSLPGKAAGNLVVPVEHGKVLRALVDKDILLGRHILLHGLMYVQVIGGHVGDNGDLGTHIHGHQLEGGQLQHHHVVRLHIGGLGQQGLADVAAHIDVIPGFFQQLGDDGGSGGLSVTSGDGDDLTGTDLEEHLHLRGDDAPALSGGQQGRGVGPEAGRPENDVLVQAVHVVGTKANFRPQALQLFDEAVEVLSFFFVAGRYRQSGPQQHLDQRRVGHANTDNRDALSLQGI